MYKTIAKIAVSAALLWLVFRGVDTEELGAQLLSVAPAAMAVALAALVVLAAVQAVRWSAVVRAIGDAYAFGPALKAVFVGLFFNQALPSSIGGDAMRMWRARQDGLPLMAAVNSVLLDRLVALGALLLIVAVGAPYLFTLHDGTEVRAVLVMIVVAGFAGLALLMVLDRMPAGLLRFRVFAAAARLSADARAVLLAPRHAVPVIVLSVLIHLGAALAVLAIARGLDIEVGWVDCMLLVPLVLLVSVLPISIAGWGLREGAMVTLFGLVGVPAAKALALSVLFGLTIMAVGVLGGAVWLASGSRRPTGDPLRAPVTPSVD